MTYTTLPGLQSTMRALGLLEQILFGMYREKASYHPRTYAGMTRQLVHDILKLRAEIDASIGLTEFAESARLLHPEADTPPPANGVHAPDPAAQPA